MERGTHMTGELAVVEEIRIGNFMAQRIGDAMEWGQGGIVPLPETAGPESQYALITASVQSLEEVFADQQGMSSCTDGRRPIRLLNDQPVPVRKQLVGANIVSAFYAAETLGARFYTDPTAPVKTRLEAVAGFLSDNGKNPSGHVNCGAGAGFAAVSQNAYLFTHNTNGLFVARAQFFLPEGVYDDAVHTEMVEGNRQRALADAYAELTPDMFLEVIERHSGKAGIAELTDDGRGVHGHTEEDILRMRVGNRALNEASLAERTGNREVFAVNDDEMEEIAALFEQVASGNGRIAHMALEDFANAGHATLSKGLPTWRIIEAN